MNFSRSPQSRLADSHVTVERLFVLSPSLSLCFSLLHHIPPESGRLALRLWREDLRETKTLTQEAGRYVTLARRALAWLLMAYCSRLYSSLVEEPPKRIYLGCICSDWFPAGEKCSRLCCSLIIWSLQSCLQPCRVLPQPDIRVIISGEVFLACTANLPTHGGLGNGWGWGVGGVELN